MKQKLAHELYEYWVTFIYLAAFFSAFTWYRSLILAEYQISSFDYWATLVQALILAKVILVGNALHLGERLGDKSLIFPTLYKAIVFVIFTAVFFAAEHTIEGLLHGKGWEAGLHEILNKGRDELLARCVVIFFCFIPFFAFQELRQALGEGKISQLFFGEREKNR